MKMLTPISVDYDTIYNLGIFVNPFWFLWYPVEIGFFRKPSRKRKGIFAYPFGYQLSFSSNTGFRQYRSSFRENICVSDSKKRYSRILLECPIQYCRKPMGFRMFGHRKGTFRNAFTIRKPSRKRKKISDWVSELLSVF